MRNEVPEGETLSREFLANERTLLSWLRTGIGAISLGILLGFAARTLEVLSGNLPGSGSRSTGLTTLAIVMVIFGSLLELLAMGRFIYYRRSIRQGVFSSPGLIYLTILISLLALGVAFAIYVVVT
jgi:putative membrane protein